MTAPATTAQPTLMEFVRERLVLCLNLIDGCPQEAAEQKALAWILGEELTGLLARLWRAAR
jgi:hypothetical protein